MHTPPTLPLSLVSSPHQVNTNRNRSSFNCFKAGDSLVSSGERGVTSPSLTLVAVCGARPQTCPKVTFSCHFNFLWPNLPHGLVVWKFSFCLFVLNFVSLLLHVLRNGLFHLDVLSILAAHCPPPPPQTGGVLYCFVSFCS